MLRKYIPLSEGAEGLMVVDWIIYAGYLAIWVLIWAGYYLWTEITDRGGFAGWVACLMLTAAASLIYYVVTDLVWGKL